MDTSFNKTMFFAIAAIAFISLASMYFVNTNAYAAYSPSQSQGDCWCIVGAYESGIGQTKTDRTGMNYQGVKSYLGCKNVCQGRESWIQK